MLGCSSYRVHTYSLVTQQLKSFPSSPNLNFLISNVVIMKRKVSVSEWWFWNPPRSAAVGNQRDGLCWWLRTIPRARSICSVSDNDDWVLFCSHRLSRGHRDKQRKASSPSKNVVYQESLKIKVVFKEEYSKDKIGNYRIQISRWEELVSICGWCRHPHRIQQISSFSVNVLGASKLSLFKRGIWDPPAS